MNQDLAEDTRVPKRTRTLAHSVAAPAASVPFAPTDHATLDRYIGLRVTEGKPVQSPTS